MPANHTAAPRQWKAWLPESALTDSRLDAMLTDVARQWSAKWFARQNVQPLGACVPLGVQMPMFAGERWLSLDADLAVAIPEPSRRTIASMMLGSVRTSADPGDGDRQVIAEMAQACIDDLTRRLAQMADLPPDSRWVSGDPDIAPVIEAPRGCGLGVEARMPLLRIVIAGELVVRLVKSGARPRPAARPLAPLASGLAAQSVTVSARLGECMVSLADLAGLGTGDVLVLDRRADAPVPLVLDGSARSAGSCAIERDRETLNLRLLEPLGGQMTS